MRRSRPRPWMALAVAAILLSGCAAPPAGSPTHHSAPGHSSGATPAVRSSATNVASSPAGAAHTSSPKAGGTAPASSTSRSATTGGKASPPASSTGKASNTASPPVTPAPVMPEAVVIGNNPYARPQAGLAQASVVWEILAEGWITRYLAIFAQTGAAKIGPIRSTRIYFDELASDYGFPLAHAGGNVDALNAIVPLHIQNLDEIYGSGAYFWRGTTRVPPNNLYTSTRLLNAAVAARHFIHRTMIYPAGGALPAGGVATATVSLNYLTEPPVYTYVAGWRWQGGWWYRTINGVPLKTQAGTAVRAGTVIILVARQAPDPDPHTPGALKILWQDGGTAWVLRGGVRLEGSWSQGTNGLPVVRAAGGGVLPAGSRTPIWYELVPYASDVSFTG